MLIAILTQYGIITFGSRGLRNGREKKEADSQRHETNTQYKYVSERKNFMKLWTDNRTGMRFFRSCIKLTFGTIVDTWSEADLDSSRPHSNLFPRQRSFSFCHSKMKNRWCGDVSWADKTHIHTQLDRPEKAQKMEESSENQKKLLEPQKSKKIECTHIAHFLCEDSTSVFM